LKPVRRWHALRAEFGDTSTTLLYLTHRLLQVLSGGRARLIPYALYAQPVPSASLQAVRADVGTRVWPAAKDELLLAQAPRPAAVLAARFSSGSRCYVCSVKESFAGYIWLAVGSHEEDEVGCRYLLPTDAVWDFDVFVEPRLRMGRTLSRLWAAVDADLAQQGVRWSFSRISRFNRASIGAHARLGARCVGRASFLRYGVWQLAWLPGRLLPRVGRHAGTLTLSAPPSAGAGPASPE